jgi:hypothetical protein
MENGQKPLFPNYLYYSRGYSVFDERHLTLTLAIGPQEVSAPVQKEEEKRKARQAILVWILFFSATVAINLLIPVALGINMYGWTYSSAKELLLSSAGYAGFFLILPLILTKGWKTVKKPSFVIPLAAAAVSIALWYFIHYIATIAIVVYIYLHWRFDLSELGFRTRGWRSDLLAILLMGSLGLAQVLAASSVFQIAVLPAFYSTLFRMFGNPASTVENFFYFGFLTERIGKQFNRYLVPFLIGAMYTAHEISNPEYWYEGSPFAFIFIGVAIFAAVYLWRRSVIVMWLGNGLQWFVSRL